MTLYGFNLYPIKNSEILRLLLLLFFLFSFSSHLVLNAARSFTNIKTTTKKEENSEQFDAKLLPFITLSVSK